MTFRHCIAAALLASVGFVHASPIVFSSPAYSVSAIADAGDDADGPHTDVGDGSLLPLQSAALALGSGGDTASGVALADALFLAATADATSTLGAASSSAVSLFSSPFDLPAGILNLSFDFDAQADMLGAALAGNLLAITLQADGVTLFDGVFNSGLLFSQDFLIPNAGTGLLDLALIATASAPDGGQAFALGSVNFALDATPVPEPSSLGLLAAGVAGLAWVRRHRRA